MSIPCLEQAIRFVGGERLSHVSIRHRSPPNSCVLGVGTRTLGFEQQANLFQAEVMTEAMNLTTLKAG